MRSMKHLALAAFAAAALALAGCGGGGGGAKAPGPTEPTPQQVQMKALETAAADAQTAVATLNGGGTATQAVIDAASMEVAKLKTALDAATDVSDEVKAGYQSTYDTAVAAVSVAQSARTAADNKAADDADKAMMALAMKLHDGISAPGGTGATTRTGAYDADGNIEVTIGEASAVDLTEDKKTAVAAMHGWTGKKYAASGTGVTGTYEATVYSNVDDPTPGAKFSAEYESGLTGGVLQEATTELEANASKVASSRFDQSAGVKAFPDTNAGGQVLISGSFHGVSGTYICVPGANNTCAVNKLASGFTLGGVASNNAFTAGNSTWTFKPSNVDARVMSVDDTIYASYGWWLHKSADGSEMVASAFAADKGDVPDITIATLSGKAKYVGGAAGMYSLYSATGGTNDAGSFSARATLDADFGATHKISGTIDNFMGADGKSRDWSVELKESIVGDNGPINSTGLANAVGNKTVWTIGDKAAAASGEWSGLLQREGGG